MKRLTLLLSFLLSLSFLSPFSSFGQKLDNTPLSICNVPPGCQEEPVCTFFDDCFRFDFYAPKDLGNGTSVLKHKITNFSESTFKRATFELPGRGASTPAAISPINTFQNRYDHSVINKFNDSLIAFDAINAGTYSYGGFEVYYYIVNNADLNAPYGRNIEVTASAGRPWQLQRAGRVMINIDNCVGVTPPVDSACIVQEDDKFRLLFPFFTVNPQGNSSMSFTLINKTASDINFIQIEAAPNSIVNPLNGSTYSSPINNPAYTYDVTNNGVLRFTRTAAPPSTLGFANGRRDIFLFDVATQAYLANGGLITVTVGNANGVVSEFLFETAECGEISPLPVTLSSFKGKLTPDGVALNWTTSSEINNDRFEIERSTTGKNFERIGEVKGNGNSSTTKTYSFVDPNPGLGTNYYRLRQVDFDGKSEYSKIVHVKNGNKAELMQVSLLPNPCLEGKCNVRVVGMDPNSPVTIEISDLTGRKVFSREIPGSQTSFELPKLDTGAGIYILSAKSGDYTAIQKVILK